MYFVSVTAFFLFSVPIYAETISQNNSTASNLGLYGGEVRYIVIDDDSNYMYAGTYSPNGVFISPDNGNTWNGIDVSNDFGEPRGLALSDDGVLFVAASSGTFKSTDRGETFTELPDVGAYSATVAYSANTLAIGRTDGVIMISRNDGDTYTTKTVRSGGVVTSLAPSPTAGTWYAVIEKDDVTTLHKTTNYGSSWTTVDTDDVAIDFYLVAVHPSDPDHVILTAEQADVEPWHSTDSGSTWTQLDVTPFVTNISFDTDGRIYFGLDYSDDNGATWSSLESFTPTSRVSGIVVPDPDNKNILYAGSFAALAKSVNRGSSWADKNEGITAVTTRDIAQSTNKRTVWVATNAGLAKTENFLSDSPTWEFPIYYDSYPYSVWVSPSNADRVVVGGFGMIVKTTDGGESWTTAAGWDSDLTAMQIINDPDNVNTLYAVGNVQEQEEVKTGGVYKSTDGGSTWTNMSFPSNRPAQTIDIDSAGRIYVGVGNIYISGDGATGIYRYAQNEWSRLSDFPNEEVTSVLVDPNDNDVLYATAANFDTYGADSDTTSGFYRSTDRGATWTRITDGLEDATKFLEITAQPGGTQTTVYLSGKDTLTEKGRVYKSKDGGLTWGVYYTGLRNETFNALLFDGLLAGNTRGLYGLAAKTRMRIRAARRVERGSEVHVRVILRDGATRKRLKNRRVTLLKRVGNRNRFVVVERVRTNRRGVAHFDVRIRKNTRFKARFVPRKRIDREEYTRTTSSVRRIRLAQ